MEISETVADERDIAYIRREYVSLEEACKRAGRDPDRVATEIAANLRPKPSYVLSDGTRYVPADYFELEIDRGSFERRLASAAASEGVTLTSGDVADEWDGFLSGLYAVCLRQPTPENIARKIALIQRIDDLLKEPRADDRAWIECLRRATDDLDAIEREFSPVLDRHRFPRAPTRDSYIRDVRAQYLK